MRRLILATTMLASGAAGALTMNISHPYGELVDRGSVTIRVDFTTAWDCTSTTVVDLANKRITLTGGLSPPGPPLNCFAPWVSVLSPLPAGWYTLTGQVASSSGAVAESATVTMDILPLEGRCNAAPELVPTMWAIHNSLTPAQLAQKVTSDPAYATSLRNPIVQPSGIVSTAYDREYAAFTYPSLENPTALSARLVESGEFLNVSRNGYACLSAPPPDSIAMFVEYYHAGLDHYFYTSDLIEIAAIDAGKVGPWSRTGKTWSAVRHPGCIPTSSDTTVYRFSGIPDKGPSSHFFTRDRAECYAVDKSAQWLLEGVPFYAAAPNADGTCPAGRVPLYRAWRPFGDSNHRFTTDRAVIAQMTAKGWIDEGVAMCVAQGT
jgi:serine protease